MIRVLQVVSAMNRGGLETFIMNVYRNIDRSKIQFDFLVHTDKKCDYDDEIKDLGGNIYVVLPRNKGVINNHRSVNSFFSNHREFNIVHQHVSSLTYLEPLKAAKRHNVTTRIIHGHSSKQVGNPLHKYLHHINKFFLGFYTTDYFSCSDLAAKWLFSKNRFESNSYTNINNGIESNQFKFDPEIRKDLRRSLKIEDKFIVGHVGRFSYPKNHDFLLDIFKEINLKKNESVLLLVGDGELREVVERKCFELGLENEVLFLGLRSDISDLLQVMDVFVFPSHYEGLPVSLVEAQSAGLMCFVSDAITKQINITKLINNISLNDSADFWADAIIEKSMNYFRVDTTNDIKSSGFDIREVAEKLMDFYMLNSRENK